MFYHSPKRIFEDALNGAFAHSPIFWVSTFRRMTGVSLSVGKNMYDLLEHRGVYMGEAESLIIAAQLYARWVDMVGEDSVRELLSQARRSQLAGARALQVLSEMVTQPDITLEEV